MACVRVCPVGATADNACRRDPSQWPEARETADPAVAKAQKRLEWLESGERGEIERRFGAAKHRYTSDCIVTKLQETSETLIHSIVLFMNLRKKLRLLLRLFFGWLQSAVWNNSEFAVSTMN